MLKPILSAVVAACVALAAAPSPVAGSAEGLDGGAAAAPATPPLPSPAAADATPAGAGARSLPDPNEAGTLTVTRLKSDGGPATDRTAVTAYHLPEDAAGGALDLTTNAGWQRAANLTLDEALEVPRGPASSQPTRGGIAVFTDLPLGVYLVTSTYTDTGAEASPPFVITIPQTNAAGDGWVYEVEAFPKAGEPLAHLGGVVWYDANANGLFDEGEETVEGVRVTVYGAARPGSRSALDVTYTDEEGWWEFTYLPVDSKIVRFDLDPLNRGGEYFEFTLPGLDSAADPATGYADPVRLIARDWVLVNAGIVSVQDGGIDLPPTPTPPPGGGGGSVGGRPALPITGATIAGFLAVAGGLIAVGIATGGAAGTEAFAKSRLRARRGGN